MSNYDKCPDCGADFGNGETCDCSECLTIGEANDIYRGNKDSIAAMMNAAYKLGYTKAEQHQKEKALPQLEL